jgi:hypothetical protein
VAFFREKLNFGKGKRADRVVNAEVANVIKNSLSAHKLFLHFNGQIPYYRY